MPIVLKREVSLPSEGCLAESKREVVCHHLIYLHMVLALVLQNLSCTVNCLGCIKKKKDIKLHPDPLQSNGLRHACICKAGLVLWVCNQREDLVTGGSDSHHVVPGSVAFFHLGILECRFLGPSSDLLNRDSRSEALQSVFQQILQVIMMYTTVSALLAF